MTSAVQFCSMEKFIEQLLLHFNASASFARCFTGPIRIAAVSIQEARCKVFLPAKSAFGR